jgi:hypothetical protein
MGLWVLRVSLALNRAIRLTLPSGVLEARVAGTCRSERFAARLRELLGQARRAGLLCRRTICAKEWDAPDGRLSVYTEYLNTFLEYLNTPLERLRFAQEWLYFALE